MPEKAPEFIQHDKVDAAESFRLGTKVFLSPDKLQAFATFNKKPPPIEELERFIRNSGIKAPLKLEQFRDLTLLITILEGGKKVPVADLREEALPVYNIQFMQHAEVIQEYWKLTHLASNVTELPKLKVLNVATGSIIGKFRPSEEMQKLSLDYFDVFGNRQAGSGRIKEMTLGAGLERKENGEITAMFDGALTLEGTRLSVVEALTINNPEKWTEGNVDFIGLANLGAKLRSFDLFAGKDVTIKGGVESAAVRSGGALRIEGPIQKVSEDKAIWAHKLVQAERIENSKVSCDQDIIIKAKIVNSEIQAHGLVTVTDGSLVGGNCHGGYGVKVFNLGAPDGTPTMVSAGYNKDLSQSLDLMRQEESVLKQKIALLHEKVKPFLEDRELLASFDSEERSAFDSVIQNMKEQRSRLDYLANWNRAHSLERTRNAEVEVTGDVYPGVTVVLQNARIAINERISKVVFQYNWNQKKIVIKPLD